LHKTPTRKIPAIARSGSTATRKGPLAYSKSLIENIPITLPTCFAIELKPGDHIHEITAGVRQLRQYWSRWVSGQVTYNTDDGGVIKSINWFLLATKYSFSGCLYKDELAARGRVIRPGCVLAIQDTEDELSDLGDSVCSEIARPTLCWWRIAALAEPYSKVNKRRFILLEIKAALERLAGNAS